MQLAQAMPGLKQGGPSLGRWLARNRAHLDAKTFDGATKRMIQVGNEIADYADRHQAVKAAAFAAAKANFDEAIGKARHDAISNPYVTNALRYITPEIFKTDFAPLFFRMVLSGVITPVPIGFRTYTWVQSTGTGEATPITNDADDLGSVKVVRKEFDQGFMSYGTSYGYSEMDSDADVAAAIPTIVEEGQECVDMVERRAESIFTIGDPLFGLNGFFNHGDVPVLGTTTGWTSTEQPALAGYVGSWLAATSDANKQQIIKDFALIAGAIRDGSNQAEMGPYTFVVDATLYFFLASTPVSTLNTTMLMTVLKQNPLIKDIVMWPALQKAGGSSHSRVIAFTDDKRKVKALEQVRFKQNAPRERGAFAWMVPCYGRWGGIILPKPRAMIYADQTA